MLLGVFYADESRGYQVAPLPPRLRPFGRCPAVSLRPPSAASFRLRLHPPTSFSPPPEFCDKRPALRTPENLAVRRGPESASLGVSSSLIATSAGGVHSCPGSQPRATVRPRRFARPRRFTPPPALRVCFTPLPRPGFALQGFVPLRGAEPGFPGPLMPSCRWTELPAVFSPRQQFRPRLQGLAPRDECGADAAG
jgi:hypothetical protein